jgi:hypothetical protein
MQIDGADAGDGVIEHGLHNVIRTPGCLHAAGGGASEVVQPSIGDARRLIERRLELGEAGDFSATFDLAHLGPRGVILGSVHDTQQAARLVLGAS